METQISNLCVSCNNNSFWARQEVAISICSAVVSGPERTLLMLSQGIVQVSVKTIAHRKRTAVSKPMLLMRRYL